MGSDFEFLGVWDAPFGLWGSELWDLADFKAPKGVKSTHIRYPNECFIGVRRRLPNRALNTKARYGLAYCRPPPGCSVPHIWVTMLHCCLRCGLTALYRRYLRKSLVTSCQLDEGGLAADKVRKIMAHGRQLFSEGFVIFVSQTCCLGCALARSSSLSS